MIQNYKIGYEKIREHIKVLEKQHWLTPTQKKWPSFLYHFSDISNIISILTGGFLYSREELNRKGIQSLDIASPNIIHNTKKEFKEFVRLYFRPKTPTQYCNEGIRTNEEIELGAHCPVPVMLLFDSPELLSRESTYYSNGNISVKNVKIDNSVDFYLSLPFKLIYHDFSFSGLSDSEKNTIKFHRHSEVLIPNFLDLKHLWYIFCRSDAERQMLMNLLPFEILNKWKEKIYVDTNANLFFGEWVFIKKVELKFDEVVFHFNQVLRNFTTSISSDKSFFKARLILIDQNTRKSFESVIVEMCPYQEIRIKTINLTQPVYYTVYFYLDKHLAFQGEYRYEEDIFF